MERWGNIIQTFDFMDGETEFQRGETSSMPTWTALSDDRARHGILHSFCFPEFSKFCIPLT